MSGTNFEETIRILPAFREKQTFQRWIREHLDLKKARNGTLTEIECCPFCTESLITWRCRGLYLDYSITNASIYSNLYL